MGHNAVVHGCTIEDRVLIGMHASILNQAIIRTGSVVAAGATVKEGQQVGPFHLVAGIPAKMKKDYQGVLPSEINESEKAYRDLAEQYMPLQFADSH